MARIRALLGFLGLADGEVLARALAVIAALTGNTHFTNLPFDLALLKTAADTFSMLIAEALDGSKKAIAAKDKQRDLIIKMLRHLAIYVEGNSNDDPAVFTSSGLLIASTTRNSAPLTLSKPRVKTITQGPVSGQLLARIESLKGAKSYELQGTALVNGVPSGAPIVVRVPNAKGAIPIDNLTPGTMYRFQVRALGPVDYTDFSDVVTRMCI